MGENIAVYEALREHILHREDEITNEIIYMYVTYFALLTVGAIWSSLISLVAFIDLIVFQSMINSSQWSITKASIYIRIFFETQRNDMHWELLHTDEAYSFVYSAINRNAGWYIRKYGSTFLALISFLSILFPALYTANWNFHALPSGTAIQIMIAFILCALTIHVNRLYFSLRDDNSLAAQKLTHVIQTFYENETGAHGNGAVSRTGLYGTRERRCCNRKK